MGLWKKVNQWVDKNTKKADKWMDENTKKADKWIDESTKKLDQAAGKLLAKEAAVEIKAEDEPLAQDVFAKSDDYEQSAGEVDANGVVQDVQDASDAQEGFDF